MADSKKVLETIKAIGLKTEAEKEYLAELGQPIGDSDHNVSMARGSIAMEGKFPGLEGKDIGTILKTMGIALVSTAGGASSPLYSSTYMKVDMTLAGKDEMDADDFLSVVDTTVQAVEQRGETIVEEATMLDAAVPSLKAMRDAAVEGKSAGEMLEAGVRAAWIGAEHTKDLIATEGRASCMGERELGHQDPGTISYSYTLEVIAGLV